MRTLLVTLAALASCGPARSTPSRRDEPAAVVRAPEAGTFTPEAYVAHVRALRAMLEDKRFGSMSIRIEDPFVVIGNGDPKSLELHARTVRWAADRLERDFFATRPTQILDVYLFEDAFSYERGVKALTGESPTTPYGFYSRTHRGLFMNIATGGGTLVHELVHPYVEADFTDAPPWLNEGLGSLFEQSADRDGHIVGLTNWRLAGLQQTIGDGHLASFRDLTHLGDNEFYGRGSGTHYAQARYLLYYLQEKQLLQTFYKLFRAARDTDPSGYTTLVSVLGEQDMAEFQKRWEGYVQALEFR